MRNCGVVHHDGFERWVGGWGEVGVVVSIAIATATATDGSGEGWLRREILLYRYCIDSVGANEFDISMSMSMSMSMNTT